MLAAVLLSVAVIVRAGISRPACDRGCPWRTLEDMDNAVCHQCRWPNSDDGF